MQAYELTGHTRAICCMHWKDNILVSGGRNWFLRSNFEGKDKVIKLWDLSTNLCVNTLPAETTIYGVWIDDNKIFGGLKIEFHAHFPRRKR